MCVSNKKRKGDHGQDIILIKIIYKYMYECVYIKKNIY